MKKFIFISFILFFTACTKENKLHRLTGNMYGSTYAIQYFSHESYDKEIVSIMDNFDEQASTYKKDSELSKFNNNEIDSITNPMLYQLFIICEDLNKKTNKYYDPTVEPLMQLWGFSKEKIKNLPQQKEIDSVLQMVGLNNIRVKKNSVVKTNKQTRLNFNSITGYINDSIANFLNSENSHSYLIEIGGEIRAKGIKADSTHWIVGIDVPKEGIQEIYSARPLYNESLATSGNYRKFFIDSLTGRKVVHTMNPKTGFPQTSQLLSATVVHKSCAYADAYATALMAMGFEDALDYLKKHPKLKALLIISDHQEGYKEFAMNGF